MSPGCRTRFWSRSSSNPGAQRGEDHASASARDWIKVPATIFLNSAFRWISGSFRRSQTFRYSRSKATRTVLVDLPLNSFGRTEKFVVPLAGRAHYLAVDSGRAYLNVPGVVGDLLEAVRPVVAAADEDPDGLRHR